MEPHPPKGQTGVTSSNIGLFVRVLESYWSPAAGHKEALQWPSDFHSFYRAEKGHLGVEHHQSGQVLITAQFGASSVKGCVRVERETLPLQEDSNDDIYKFCDETTFHAIQSCRLGYLELLLTFQFPLDWTKKFAKIETTFAQPPPKC